MAIANLTRGAKTFCFLLSITFFSYESRADPSLSSQQRATTSPSENTRSAFDYNLNKAALAWHDFVDHDGLVIVDVELDGKTVPALIDSGASWSAYFLHTGDDLKPQFKLNGIGGQVDAGLSHHHRIRIGGADIKNTSLIRFPKSKDFASQPFQLLIGADILSRYALQVDWAHRKLRFLLAGDTPDNLPSWPIKTELAFPDESGKGLKFTTDIAVCGQNLRSQIDSGDAGHIEILKPSLPQTGCQTTLVSDEMSAGVGGRVTQVVNTLPSLAVGFAKIGAVPANMAEKQTDLVSPDISASIGNAILRRFNYTFDPIAERIVFWGSGTTAPSHDRNMTGLQFELGTPLTIMHVMSNSPAWAAGLKAGNTLCRINTQDVMADGKALKLLREASEGQRLTVTLCGQQRKVSFVAHDFLGVEKADGTIHAPVEQAPVSPLTEAAIACSPNDGPTELNACDTLIAANRAFKGLKWSAAIWKAKALENQSRFAEAERAATQAIGFDPANPTGFLIRAEINGRQAHFPPALNDAETALKLDPASIFAQDYVATTNAATGRYQRALDVARVLAVSTPDDPLPFKVAAYALYHLGKLPEARAMAERAISLGTGAGDCWAIHAMILQATGAPTQARQSLAKAVSLFPNDFFVLEAKSVVEGKTSGER